ncbi:hypothetical protein LIER_20210 [Lithospermum erythrorhizon]|uniref:Uncharacterized protein n=1 Tax=Lithospermum erythrorhizon TaxID=34254 RepID=A0AAV3QKL8_LITER
MRLLWLFLSHMTINVALSFVAPSPEYTPSVRHAVIADPRWVALCCSLCGKSLSHLRVMDESTFDRLKVDLGHDPDFPVMRATMENFFYFVREMRWRQPHHLSFLQDAHSSSLSQALHNRGGLSRLPGDSPLTQLTVGILTDFLLIGLAHLSSSFGFIFYLQHPEAALIPKDGTSLSVANTKEHPVCMDAEFVDMTTSTPSSTQHIESIFRDSLRVAWVELCSLVEGRLHETLVAEEESIMASFKALTEFSRQDLSYHGKKLNAIFSKARRIK